MKIQIAHLYPEILNLYGDKGNIASLSQRLSKRGIEVCIKKYGADEKIDFDKTDIVFIGGGTDKDNKLVCAGLMSQKDEFKAYVENGGVVLAVCGGFEIIGKYIKTPDGDFETLGLADFHVFATKERHIGNIVIKSDITEGEIVGFENHSCKIVAGDAKCLGTVIAGCGNGNSSGKEGIVYKNLIATHLHGPLLPKNPLLTDYILEKAIERKYGKKQLSPLDDSFENAAHDYAVKRFSKKS